MYQLRPYQQEAVDASVDFLKRGRKGNGLVVLPTGAGKSLCIAAIAKALGEPTLVFQPSKEILEQNFEKLTMGYGQHATIYSASMGQKEISGITFATIGSVKAKPWLFSHFKHIIADECHAINSKAGMYKDFLQSHDGRVLGLTATPYRLSTDAYGGSILKFLTRTRPRVFGNLIYHVQNGDLFKHGYLAPLEYVVRRDFDRGRLKVNSTGADYTDASVQDYYQRINFADKLVDEINAAMQTHRNCLVFTRFVAESEYLVSKIPHSAIVTGSTPKGERESVAAGFKSGRIKVVCNVGVYTTGFDYPELETVLIARPTMSLALYYQMVGRCVRPHKDKPKATVIDLCGNFARFGKVEDLRIVDGGNGKWHVSNGKRQLTNVYYGD